MIRFHSGFIRVFRNFNVFLSTGQNHFKRQRSLHLLNPGQSYEDQELTWIGINVNQPSIFAKQAIQIVVCHLNQIKSSV